MQINKSEISTMNALKIAEKKTNIKLKNDKSKK